MSTPRKHANAPHPFLLAGMIVALTVWAISKLLPVVVRAAESLSQSP